MRTASAVLIAVVCALAAQTLYAQQYPGCKTDAQCQVTGDSVRGRGGGSRERLVPFAAVSVHVAFVLGTAAHMSAAACPAVELVSL